MGVGMEEGPEPASLLPFGVGSSMPCHANSDRLMAMLCFVMHQNRDYKLSQIIALFSMQSLVHDLPVERVKAQAAYCQARTDQRCSDQWQLLKQLHEDVQTCYSTVLHATIACS